MDRSLPSQASLALPKGITKSSSSGTSPFKLYSMVFSITHTGSLSLIAAFIIPLASAGVAGQITLIPGVFAAKFSGV